MSWDTLISHQSTLNKNGELDMNLFDTQNFLGSELGVGLKILDLEVDLAVV